MHKKPHAIAQLLSCQSKPIAFLPFSLPSPLSLLKLPNKYQAPARVVKYLGRGGGGTALTENRRDEGRSLGPHNGPIASGKSGDGYLGKTPNINCLHTFGYIQS